MKNVEKSVQIAKDAVSMDIKDGESWCNIPLKKTS